MVKEDSCNGNHQNREPIRYTTAIVWAETTSKMSKSRNVRGQLSNAERIVSHPAGLNFGLIIRITFLSLLTVMYVSGYRGLGSLDFCARLRVSVRAFF